MSTTTSWLPLVDALVFFLLDALSAGSARRSLCKIAFMYRLAICLDEETGQTEVSGASRGGAHTGCRALGFVRCEDLQPGEGEDGEEGEGLRGHKTTTKAATFSSLSHLGLRTSKRSQFNLRFCGSEKWLNECRVPVAPSLDELLGDSNEINNELRVERHSISFRSAVERCNALIQCFGAYIGSLS